MLARDGSSKLPVQFEGRYHGSRCCPKHDESEKDVAPATLIGTRQLATVTPAPTNAVRSKTMAATRLLERERAYTQESAWEAPAQFAKLEPLRER